LYHLIVDIHKDNQGTVIESLGRRGAELKYMVVEGDEWIRLEYVITATSTKVAFSTTLQDSLNLLVGGGTSTAPTGTVSTTPGQPGTTTPATGAGAQSLAQQALQHLQAYQQAEGKGDFATAGQELAALAKVLQEAASPSPTPSPSPSKS